QRAAQARPVERALARRIGGGHEIGPARDGGERIAARERLAVGGEVGRDAVELLGAAVGEAEARDDLVEDQDDLLAPRDLAKLSEKAGLRRNGALERLQKIV